MSLVLCLVSVCVCVLTGKAALMVEWRVCVCVCVLVGKAVLMVEWHGQYDSTQSRLQLLASAAAFSPAIQTILTLRHRLQCDRTCYNLSPQLQSALRAVALG